MAIEIQWSDRQPLPVAKSGAATALVDSRLVLAGGSRWLGEVKEYLDRVDVYDSARDEWKTAPQLPSPLGYGASCAIRDDLLAIGGTDGRRIVRDCWRLHGRTTWEHDGVFPDEHLVLSRGVTMGETVLVFAGARDPNDLSHASSSVLARSAGSQWERVSAIPYGPSCFLAAAALGDCIYVFGGCFQSNQRKIVNRADAAWFDLRSNQWRKLRPLPHAMRGASALTIHDRFILLLGGYMAVDDDLSGEPPEFGYSSAVWAYDIEQDRYERATPLPFGVMGTDFFLSNQTIYGGGGEQHRLRGRSARLLAGTIGNGETTAGAPSLLSQALPA